MQLKKEGVLILAGKTKYEVDNDENFGIVIFQAESEEKAHEIMKHDPALAQHIMTAELHPFKVAL